MDAYEYLMSQLKMQSSKWDFVNSWPHGQVLSMCRFAEEFHDRMTPKKPDEIASQARGVKP